jgi:hypothetical protein
VTAWRVVRGFLTADEREQLSRRYGDRGWERGRQETGYLKSAVEVADPLFAALIARSLATLYPGPRHGHDAWLLRYPDGASIPPHVDPPLAAGARHARLNAIIAAPPAGGVLRLDGEVVELAPGDAVVFRPDRVRHEVSAVRGGERWVWSVGCNHDA